MQMHATTDNEHGSSTGCWSIEPMHKPDHKARKTPKPQFKMKHARRLDRRAVALAELGGGE